MPNIGNFSASVNLDFRKAEAQAKRFQSTLSKGFQRNGLGKAAGDARDFERTLGQATNRVVAFGAAAVVFNTLSRSVSSFADSIIEVDKALTEINVNLGQSADGLKTFSTNLFNAARQTGQTFETAAKSAVELARQGLSAEETIKRLNDGLVLTRISGLSAEDSISALTAAINTFNKEALTSADVVAKFAAVDTQFAVSSKDLAEAVSRVGSAAQSAGVGIDQLIGLVTSLQQTTQLGGSNIANALKTIFTRVTANPETIQALQSVGVSIKDTNGNLRDGISILQDYARAREGLGEVERQALDRTVGSTFQINKLKAALTDVAKVNGIYAQATKTSANATDEAIRKNAQLNQTLSSLINQTGLSIKQLVSSIGDIDFSPLLKSILQFVETSRRYLSGESGDELGKSLGNGLLHGLSNVLSGPVLAGIGVVLFSAFRKIFSTIAAEAQTLFKINTAAATRIKIQERINVLIQNASAFEMAQYNAAKSVAAQKEVLIGIQQRLNRELLIGTELQNSLLIGGPMGGSVNPGVRPGRRPVFADPIASAIQQEAKVSGLATSQIYVDRDPRVSSPSNPNGILVANRRDEPLGGHQGVQRVIAAGGNPKTGSVPGFALTGKQLPFVPKKVLDDINKLIGLAQDQTTKAGFYSEISKVTDISLSGKLSKSNTKTLDKEIDKVITDRLKLERQIEIGRFKGAKRAKEFAEQNARLAELQEQLKKNATKVEATRLVRASGLSAYSSPIGPKAPGYPSPIGPALHPMRSGPYDRPIGPISPFTNMRVVNGTQGAMTEAEYEAAGGYQGQLRRDGLSRPSVPPVPLRKKGLPPLTRAQKREMSEQDREYRAQLDSRNRNRAFGLAFLAPFAGGFVPDAPGGTSGGILSGAAKGASEGASAGVFGPQAAVIGVAVGALIGALSKATQSTEEFNEVIDKGVAAQQASVDAIGRFVTLTNSLKEPGVSNEALGRFGRQRAEALQGVDPEFRNQLSNANLTESQIAEIVGKAQEKARQASISGDIQKGARGLNNPDAITKAFGSATSLARVGSFFKRQVTDLFGDQFEGINQARSIGGSLSSKITDQNVSSIDQSLLNRIIGGKGGVGDTAKLASTFDSLGVKVEVSADRQIEFAEALKTAVARFKEVGKIIESFKTTAQPIGLRPGAFNSTANSAPLQSAAFTGRNPFLFSQTQKGKSQYGFYQELINAGALDEKRLEEGGETSPFKRAQASNRSDNALRAGLDYVKSSRLGGGQYTDFRGEPIAKALESALRSLSKDKGQNGEQAKVLLDLIGQAQQTRANAGLKTPPVSSGYNLPRGVTYSTYAPGSPGGFNGYDAGAQASDKNRAQAYFAAHVNRGKSGFTVAPSAETVAANAALANQPKTAAATPTALAVNVNVDGALKLISEGMDSGLADLLNTKVNQAVIDATAEYFKDVQPQLNDLNARVAVLAGKPLVPTPVVHNPMNAVRRLFKIPNQNALPVADDD